MSTSRIGTLALHIRADDAQRALASDCATLARRVLERVVEQLDHGDRVILIRRLEIRWRLPEEAIAAEHAVARLAADLIAALRPAWSDPVESPDPEENAVVFPDITAWWSDALMSRAERTIAWYHAPVFSSEPLLVLAEPPQRTLALAILHRWGRKAAYVLSRSPENAVQRLADAFGVVVPDWLISYSLEQERVEKHSPGVFVESVLPIQEIRSVIGRRPNGALAGLSALAIRLAELPGTAGLETAMHGFAETLASTAVASPRPIRGETEESEQAVAGVPRFEATAYAGLFFLATLMVELGTGEHLWRACLPEGRFLSWAAKGLIADDPVVNWFGDGDGDGVIPAVSPTQADEVVAALLDNILAALPRRRSDVSVPPLELTLRGEELFATLPASVFPVWSAGGLKQGDLRQAVASLSNSWPGRLIAPKSWRDYGLAQNLQYADTKTRDVFRHEGSDPAARIATLVIGSAASLFEWRLGEVCETSASAFVERHLRLHGRLEDTGDRFIVHLRSTEVSFPARRAGLDRDPGYLPWLGRSVLIRFEGEEPEGDELPRLCNGPR